jgi:NTE family protein
MTHTTTAFVLSGGGSLGAVQVGMLAALAENGIRPDVLVGTSAGAMNAAWVAAHGLSPASLDDLAAVWVGLRRSDVFPVDVRRVVRSLLGWGPAMSTADRLRALVVRHVGDLDLSDATVPVHFVAADALTGRSVLVSDGPLADGVLASAAIPGVFPPVALGGRLLVDGALADRSGLSHAVSLGATETYLLPAGAPCALEEPPGSALGMAVHAVALLLEQRLVAEVRSLSGRSRLRALPPLCPLAVSATDFGHGAELVERGRRSALDWLAGGGTELPAPARFLRLHDHAEPPVEAAG